MEQVKAEPVALKPVDQTVLGIGNPRANCFQACLAMVTGIPLEQCVDITDPEIEDGQWIAPVEAWAAKHGLRFVTGIKAPMDRPYIANGPTAERAGVHGVVCVGHELFHDPHPSRAGIVSVNWYGWFEPLYATPQPAAVDGLVEAARAIEPFLDAIVCFASTMDEHEPNRLAENFRQAIAQNERTEDGNG